MSVHNTYTTRTNTHSQIHTHIQPAGFPGGAAVKNPPADVGDPRHVDLILGSGRSPGEGNGYPLQYSCLGNMNRGGWWVPVYGVATSRTRLPD